MSSGGDLILPGNGRRPVKQRGSDFATKNDVVDISKQITEHYLGEIADFVNRAVYAALQTYDRGRREEFNAAMVALLSADPEPTGREVIQALRLAFGPITGLAQPETPA